MPRVLEVGLAALLLAVLSPLLLIVALANRLAGGAVFFRQVRLGRGLVPFTILKFRTMAPPPPGATTVAGADRERITALGRLLRASKIDEMPQLINVLRGEMSLVGPRALTPNEIARVPLELSRAVYAVRPGMTGLASLVFSDEERQVLASDDPEAHYFAAILPQKMSLETAYARRRSLTLDLLLLALTPLAMISPSAARALARRLALSFDAPAGAAPQMPSGEASDG